MCEDQIKSLIAKAEKENNSLHAMQYAQAALNAANAARVMVDTKIASK